MRRPVSFPFAALAVLSAFLTIAIGTVSAAPPPALLSIAVTPANPSVPAGSSQRFTAIGTFSDARSIFRSSTTSPKSCRRTTTR